MTLPDDLLPGDGLLYESNDIADWVIDHLTGGPVAHCEGYAGAGQSVASRNGIGVGLYPLRTDGLVAVIRPTLPFDPAKAMAWFATVNGEGYDFPGLLDAITPGDITTPRHLFCSAFLTLWYRAGGFNANHPDCPANKVWPVDFLKFYNFNHLLAPPGW